MRPRALCDVSELKWPREPTVVAEQLVQRLRGLRQEGREEDLETVDSPQRNVEDRRCALPILLDDRPRLLLRHVLVREPRKAHRLLESVLEPSPLDEGAGAAG